MRTHNFYIDLFAVDIQENRMKAIVTALALVLSTVAFAQEGAAPSAPAAESAGATTDTVKTTETTTTTKKTKKMKHAKKAKKAAEGEGSADKM